MNRIIFVLEKQRSPRIVRGDIMGTSAGYDAPASWGDLKAEVTRSAKLGAVSQAAAKKIIGNFVRANGGSAGMARGVAGGGVGGQAPAKIARRMGAFVADVGNVGLNEALERVGLSDLVGRPVREILSGLLDRLGGSASTIDDVDARAALARLQEDYLGDAPDSDALERILSDQASNLEALLSRYFCFYLYEYFCRVFFERLVQRVGENDAYLFLKEIEEFIGSTLANRTFERDLADIDWSGAEGSRLTSEIMKTTLDVFGG